MILKRNLYEFRLYPWMNNKIQRETQEMKIQMERDGIDRR